MGVVHEEVLVPVGERRLVRFCGLLLRVLAEVRGLLRAAQHLLLRRLRFLLHHSLRIALRSLRRVEVVGDAGSFLHPLVDAVDVPVAAA